MQLCLQMRKNVLAFFFNNKNLTNYKRTIPFKIIRDGTNVTIETKEYLLKYRLKTIDVWHDL